MTSAKKINVDNRIVSQMQVCYIAPDVCRNLAYIHLIYDRFEGYLEERDPH